MFFLPDWLARYRLGGLTRGLYLYGPTGRGKTFHLKAIRAFIRMPYLDENKLKNVYREDVETFEEILTRPHASRGDGDDFDLLIDELGGENTLVDYGNRVDIAAEVIRIRHEMFQRHGAKTMLTGNLPPQGIRERYGDRIHSRLLEMCRCVSIGGCDLRQ
ncbi:hypothetical protein P0136_10585 [Lentisphaerota bacterium ZTH]|nr:hypothetical protein JYG24_11900 [Lentisphaerota bacterium]WET05807.1 hypothetical protein P0136_10585 [Lentisphaerota bacterium ZTH]